VDVENCTEESHCDGAAEADAEVNGECDGQLTLCSATAIADVELDGCDDGNYCSANALSEANVEDCDGFDNGLDVDVATRCVAYASGEAVANDNSNASATNIAVADAWGVDPACTGTPIAPVCTSDGAEAWAAGDAIATGESTATVNNLAVADGPSTSAQAGGIVIPVFDVDDDGDIDGVDYVTIGGDAVATNGSTASSNQVAVADGPDATALALGGAQATDGSVATADGQGVAVDGANAMAFTGAYAADGGVATAANSQNAEGAGSVAAGAVTAAAIGADNTAAASSTVAVDGGATIASFTSATSAVDSGIYGTGVGVSAACTTGQTSCVFGNAMAIASGTEGVALADTAGYATNGQDLSIAAGATTNGACAGGAYASLTQTASGSWEYNGGFNAGLSCVSTNANVLP
jgi:hypothetical protein